MSQTKSPVTEFRNKVKKGIITYGLKAIEEQRKWLMEHPKTKLPEGVSFAGAVAAYDSAIRDYVEDLESKDNFVRLNDKGRRI